MKIAGRSATVRFPATKPDRFVEPVRGVVARAVGRPRLPLALLAVAVLASGVLESGVLELRTPSSPAGSPAARQAAHGPGGSLRARRLLGGWLPGSSTAAAQEPAAARHRHAWGRFGAGSWKHVRILAEQFDAQGAVVGTTTTETTSTLEKAAEQYYTLSLETSIEAGGRKFGGDRQSVTQGYYGETSGQKVTIRRTGETELTIGGRAIGVEASEVLIAAANGWRRSSVVHGSPKSSPYVLKRVTTEVEGEGKPATKTVVEVTALDMPFRVLDELLPVALVRTTETLSDGASAVSYEAFCADVPGGIVWQSSKVLNPAGKVVRRSVLELLDYHTEPGPAEGPNQPPRRRRFGRSRPSPTSGSEKTESKAP